jgi:hypothetical protein
VEEREDLELIPPEWTVDASTRDVIPIGTGFAIAQQKKTIVKAARRKMMNFVMNDGGQTDPTVAHRSE